MIWFCRVNLLKVSVGIWVRRHSGRPDGRTWSVPAKQTETHCSAVLPHNKFHVYQPNNSWFIIHETACNLFVFIRKVYNHVSGSIKPLSCIPAVSLPSADTDPLLNPTPHHLSFLSHYKTTLFLRLYATGKLTFNVGMLSLSRWLLEYSKQNKTQHQYCSQPNGMHASLQSGNLKSGRTPCTFFFVKHRCRHGVWIFMHCCAVFTQTAWSIETWRTSPKESAILWPSAALDKHRQRMTGDEADDHKGGVQKSH